MCGGGGGGGGGGVGESRDWHFIICMYVRRVEDDSGETDVTYWLLSYGISTTTQSDNVGTTAQPSIVTNVYPPGASCTHGDSERGGRGRVRGGGIRREEREKEINVDTSRIRQTDRQTDRQTNRRTDR